MMDMYSVDDENKLFYTQIEDISFMSSDLTEPDTYQDVLSITITIFLSKPGTACSVTEGSSQVALL